MKKNDIVIFGAGGFGREVIEQLDEVNQKTKQYKILGFIDDTKELEGKFINGYKVLGNTDWLLNYEEKLCVVVCIGNPLYREKVINIISKNSNLDFPYIISENVKLSKSVKIGRGSIICSSSTLTVNIDIGDFVILNLDCTVGHDSIVGDFATIYPSVNISGNVNIGRSTEIGTGVNIIQGKSIGTNTVVGAGSVVTRDIPDNCTAVGIPAAPIKYRQI